MKLSIWSLSIKAVSRVDCRETKAKVNDSEWSKVVLATAGQKAKAHFNKL